MNNTLYTHFNNISSLTIKFNELSENVKQISNKEHDIKDLSKFGFEIQDRVGKEMKIIKDSLLSMNETLNKIINQSNSLSKDSE